MIVLPWLIALPLAAAPAHPPALVEQFDDTGFYQLESPSFTQLTPKERLLAYWLGRAAIALDPIAYDQFSRFGLAEKRLLGGMVADPARLPAESRDAIVRYAKLFFANKGNHNDITNQKFVPQVPVQVFRAAAHAARKAGAPLGDEKSLDQVLTELDAPLFDPAFEPSPTVKNPPAGKDIITGSSNTFYGPGVTLKDLEGFQDKYPLNSRVEKEGGKLVERVYRAGTPDGSVKPGLYAPQLGAVVDALRQAERFADAAQAKVLEDAVRYLQTGEEKDLHTFNVDWVQNDATVDFVNGFIETYRDPRAAKGSAAALVCVTDLKLQGLMRKLAANALYFEKKAPWLDVYKKLEVKPPVGKAVEVLSETADFGFSTIGDNLPNQEDIHRELGTKNFLMSNTSAAFVETNGRARAKEFQPQILPLFDKAGALTDNLLTALHEVTGHGSGKSRNPKEPRETLREYYSSLEEARADLVAYWNINDPKLHQFGVDDQDVVVRLMYEHLANSFVGVLAHYPAGDQIEEDHDRDRMLIWNWVAASGGIGLVEKNGKHYGVVKDLKKAHQAVGKLLAELMRIKGEGDYQAIKALTEKYALHFDPKLRDEVVARMQSLHLPTYSAGIYADLTLVKDASGEPTDVAISYPRDFLRQQLDYAKLNGTLGF